MANQTLKQLAIEFLTLAASGKLDEAYGRYVGPGFRHHNPYYTADMEALKRGMQDSTRENPGTTLKVQRALQDGNEVAVHSHVKLRSEDRGFAVVHICRFEGDRIVEFWDIAQAVPEDSRNAHGMF
jgi:predicted SnoaL-like aldol condensation-catalyzing enzyme